MIEIVTNIAAQLALNSFNRNSANVSTAIAALASGSAINSAADNPAGLAIATALGTQNTVDQAVADNNLLAGSQITLAESGLRSIGQVLTRLAQLATQAQGTSLSPTARAVVESEYQQLAGSIDKTAAATNLTGGVISLNQGYKSQTSLTLPTATTAALGLAGSTASAADTPANIQAAQQTVSNGESRLGAAAIGLQAGYQALQSQFVNDRAALSTVQDADVGQMISQASSSKALTALAANAEVTANQIQQHILQLFNK